MIPKGAQFSKQENSLVGLPQCGIRYVMTEPEMTVLRALVELEEMVHSMATANPKPSLLPLFARLDDLTRRLPPETDPTLLHYLHKKSYEKARLFLQGREAENRAGNCPH